MSSPSASEIKQLLSVVGIEAEDDRLEKFLSGVQGKDLQELIAEVSTKLSWVASGAGGAGAAFAASSAINVLNWGCTIGRDNDMLLLYDSFIHRKHAEFDEMTRYSPRKGKGRHLSDGDGT
ncbi:hypothetical protein F5877DRAFT_77412 [Lentinula edodes]|nr:hypothetical protein F5877DRAFT_77412 [Lentinula edodes]